MNDVQIYLEVEKHCKDCPYASHETSFCNYLSEINISSGLAHKGEYKYIRRLTLSKAVLVCNITKLRKTVSKKRIKTLKCPNVI